LVLIIQERGYLLDSLDYSQNGQILDKKKMYCSGTCYVNETTIIIIGNDGWALATAYEWCSGNGTLNDPYIIENLTINGQGVSYCIRIRDCNIFFKIKNCAISNATSGIILVDAFNGKLTTNKLSNNTFGIHLKTSDNINISANSVSYNNKYGIYTYRSSNNIIMENTASLNSENGIHLEFSNNNTILGNIANSNVNYGIFLFYSNDNLISENILVNNKDCIKEDNCLGNKFENNFPCFYGENRFIISGYEIFFIILIFSFFNIVLVIFKISKCRR